MNSDLTAAKKIIIIRMESLSKFIYYYNSGHLLALEMLIVSLKDGGGAADLVNSSM